MFWLEIVLWAILGFFYESKEEFCGEVECGFLGF